MNFKQQQLYEDALKWLDKHRAPWQQEPETEEDTKHLAAILADFAYHRWQIEKRSAALSRGDSGLNHR